MAKLKILAVDDDPVSLTSVSRRLEKAGYDVSTASGGSEAVEMVSGGFFDVVITDLVMPEVDGIAVLESVKQRHPLTEVIVVTGFADVETAVAAMKNGAADYLQKPVNFEELELRLQKLEEMLEIGHDLQQLAEAKHATESHAADTIKTLESMVAELQQVRTQVLDILENQDLQPNTKIESAREVLLKCV